MYCQMFWVLYTSQHDSFLIPILVHLVPSLYPDLPVFAPCLQTLRLPCSFSFLYQTGLCKSDPNNIASPQLGETRYYDLDAVMTSISFS